MNFRSTLKFTIIFLMVFLCLGTYFFGKEYVNKIFAQTPKDCCKDKCNETDPPICNGVTINICDYCDVNQYFYYRCSQTTCPNQPQCAENWSCGVWSTCTNGSQSRTCTDQNNCGSTMNRPSLQQTCQVACTEDWVCGAWSSCSGGSQSRACTDRNNCGSTMNRPSLQQTCQISSSIIYPVNNGDAFNVGDVITVKANIAESVQGNAYLYNNSGNGFITLLAVLYDDGAHGDSLSNDGIWGNSIFLTTVGTINLELRVNGVSYPNLRSINVVNQATCVDLVNNGASVDKLDIVFIGDNYTSADMALFASDVTAFSNVLLSVPPFSTQASKINVHRIDNTADLGCNYNCHGIARLICCNVGVTWGISSACPYDQIIVLMNSATYGGGGGGGLSVSYRNEPRIAVHEFGHTFANLRDEYISYPSNGPVDGMGDDPNCDDTAGCAKWVSTPGTACLSGCTYPNWFRSINTGIMKNHNAASFGQVNVDVINGRLNNFQ